MSHSSNEEKVEAAIYTDPDVSTILQIIKNAILKLKDKTAIILWSSFILLALWGVKGDAKLIFPVEWRKALFPGIPWRDQLVSFLTGFILLVVIPCCIIKFRFKERLADYGLGWKKERVKLGLVALCFLLVGFAIFFYVGTFFEAQRAEYPMFRNAIPKGAWGAFIVYELVYFLFFIVIEFIFRGYLLFGLYGIKDIQAAKGVKGIKGPYVFGVYAILIQMLPYIVWHLPKPPTEYLGALVWGVVVAAIALKTRSLWTIIIAHWLLNVFMDTVIWLKYPLVP